MKRMIINAVATLVVVGGGAARLMAQSEILPPACCHTVFTSATCCGDTCESGWFNCSAQSK
ncbi:MAG TPA: hypothetical protein VN706_06450 [Gemmatimonadaceae bacterium]|nr:hypothetical protein [Gemmatimonadaceae bacterium]